MPKLFDTGEMDLLASAERSEKLAASAAKHSLSKRSRDFVTDHPVAAVGAAAGVAAGVALVSKSRLGGRLIAPARIATTTLIASLFRA